MGQNLRELKREFRANFAKMGEEQVRITINRGLWSGTRLKWAIEWLGEADQKSRALSEASNSESLRIARSAKNAAWAAVIMAATAAIIAAASMVIAYFAFQASGQ